MYGDVHCAYSEIGSLAGRDEVNRREREGEDEEEPDAQPQDLAPAYQGPHLAHLVQEPDMLFHLDGL